MQRERVSENVYWFQSDTYAQVSAGAIAGPQWAVVIDTLMPQETPEIRDFIEKSSIFPSATSSIPTTTLTTVGELLFPNATIIGHEICRQKMMDRAPAALEVASQDIPLYKKLKSSLQPSLSVRAPSI